MTTCLSYLLIVVAPFAAQGHGNPAPKELDGLRFLVGAWKGKQNFNNPGAPMVGDITLKVHEFAGRYLEEDLSTTLPGRKPTEVHHMISFDPGTKQFKAWWFNDTSSVPTQLDGSLEGDRLVLLSHPSNPNAPVLRATYDHVSASALSYKLEMKAGEGWQELFHNDFTRR